MTFWRRRSAGGGLILILKRRQTSRKDKPMRRQRYQTNPARRLLNRRRARQVQRWRAQQEAEKLRRHLQSLQPIRLSDDVQVSQSVTPLSPQVLDQVVREIWEDAASPALVRWHSDA